MDLADLVLSVCKNVKNVFVKRPYRGLKRGLVITNNRRTLLFLSRATLLRINNVVSNYISHNVINLIVPYLYQLDSPILVPMRDCLIMSLALYRSQLRLSPLFLGSIVTFILFTDMCIYWIHRCLHHKLVYKYIHKPHHKWKVPSPFASHAFHPLDGFLQSCPYHIYPFIFPLHKYTYLLLFIFVNIWTVSIHDGEYHVPQVLKPFINGSAHHTDHHLFYNYNYGQFFTLWDHIGGSFRYPSAFEGKGPMVDVLNKEKESYRQNGHLQSSSQAQHTKEE
ncbi:hypothetical protein ACJMK2_026835 [Sinanodonta woodiana]|uniref:Fatty acid hydroxylase domain-containing protein n=1 Tax=Sinanodonta woodiana TaxID=1069815 RepID=A0ABD3XL11_SINWO